MGERKRGVWRGEGGSTGSRQVTEGGERVG